MGSTGATTDEGNSEQDDVDLISEPQQQQQQQQ